MSRRRNSAAASGSTSATGASRKPEFGERKLVSTILMLAATAVMLPLLFPPFYCFFLAPVALAPLCLCIVRRPLSKWNLLAYYLTGVAFFLPNLYWLAPVTIGGFIALALFLALYFVLFAVGVQRLVVQMRLPATIAVPLVWTAVEYLRATFIQGGFPWFLLGNSLTPLPVLIQAADIFGVWGLTFLIAMMNGFVVDLLRLPLRQVVKGKRAGFSSLMGRLIAAVSLVCAAYLSYGVFRLGETTTRPGPRVAVIQENIPQSVKDAGTDDDDIFNRHLQLTLAAAKAEPKPDLIAWPETMVPGFGNLEFLTAPDKKFATFEAPEYWPHLRDRTLYYFAQLGHVTDTYDVPLLLGMGSLDPRTNFADSIKQNRTLLLEPRVGPVAYYAKVHLVPFGEYIPFRSLPWIGKYMIFMSPIAGVDFSDVPGTAWTRFTLAVSSRSTDAGEGGAGTQISSTTRFYKFGTPICFEDTMPEPARRMTAPQYDGGRKADFLINVSNDGWFQSVELDQHLQACQLRAVENRVPIARSVNTGDSGFIDSCGRVVKLVRDGQGNTIGAVGTEAWVMQIDARVTVFSRIGDLLPIICGILATLLLGWTLVRPRRAGPATSAARVAP